MDTRLWIIGYVVLINIIAFIMMGIDKSKAERHAWRISEATFFLISIVGGSLGSILGMYTFRHKTKHWYFVLGMPIILLIQLAIIAYLFFAPGISITII